MNRQSVFNVVKMARKDVPWDSASIAVLDDALDKLGVARASEDRNVNAAGLALMRQFEGCKLCAYPDPGSRDGNPWTIGWGSTGPGIAKGVTWTQAQADERHEADVAKFAAGVAKLIGDAPTTDNQFAALVSLAYNIGTGSLATSTALSRHKSGDHGGAAEAILWFNKNDGKVMPGLVRRRKAEAELYLRRDE